MRNDANSKISGHTVLMDGDLTLELVDIAPHPVHKVLTYFFRIVHKDAGEELGRINLRAQNNPHIELYAGHIGYSVHPQYRGHRYAARSLRLLLPFARKLGINPIWITCDPENTASRRSCELAGAKFVEVVDVPEECIIHRDGHTRKCRYRLDLFETATHPNRKLAAVGHSGISDW